MERKKRILGIAVLALAAFTARTTPAYDRFVASVETFQNRLHSLKASGKSLSPIERIVFTLVFTSAEQPQSGHSGAALTRRT